VVFFCIQKPGSENGKCVHTLENRLKEITLLGKTQKTIMPQKTGLGEYEERTEPGRQGKNPCHI
jgi:hypothetical protein